MKKTTKYLSLLLIVLFSASLFQSCNNDDDELQGVSAPVIEYVAASVDENGQAANPLVATEIGYANNTYVIHGKGFSSLRHIYFNDYESQFNPNLVTDTDIFITINKDTPYSNVSNKLKLETAFGTVEYDFVIAPPVPVFSSFNPVNAADGEVITLKGNYFVDPVVKVGETEAEVISNTLTEIKIKLPEGSQDKKITVTTLSGDSTWDTAIGSAIFDDVFYGGWNIEEWNNHQLVTDPENAYQGNVYIQKEISGWDNIQFNWIYNEEVISKYDGIQFAVRSDAPGKLQMVFNGDWSDNAERTFTTDKEWTVIKLTWAQLGNPTEVKNITFKESSGQSHTYSFDNITYIKE